MDKNSDIVLDKNNGAPKPLPKQLIECRLVQEPCESSRCVIFSPRFSVSPKHWIARKMRALSSTSLLLHWRLHVERNANTNKLSSCACELVSSFTKAQHQNMYIFQGHPYLHPLHPALETSKLIPATMTELLWCVAVIIFIGSLNVGMLVRFFFQPPRSFYDLLLCCYLHTLKGTYCAETCYLNWT